MTGSRNNIIAMLYESGRTVFRLKDIALFTGQTDALLLAKRLDKMNGDCYIDNPSILNRLQ